MSEEPVATDLPKGVPESLVAVEDPAIDEGEESDEYDNIEVSSCR